MTLIRAEEPVARAILGDTPYTATRMDTEDTGIGVRAGSLHLDAAGAGISLPDRSLTPYGASHHRQPEPIVIVGSHIDQPERQKTSAGFQQLVGRPVEAVSVGSSHGKHPPLRLRDLIDRGRRAGVALVALETHRSGAEAAQIILALAGAGVPVVAVDPAPLERFLHPELIDTLDTDPRAVIDDPLQWGLTSVGQRRIAWSKHDLRLEWPDASGIRLVAPPEPSVSVVLSTRRPEFIPAAVEMIAGQRYGSFELILVIHGDDPAMHGLAQSEVKNAGLAHVITSVDGAVPLGGALNHAIHRSSGQIVSKWDDDDFYGVNHLTDMTIALRYSRAGLVGKAPEFIHFAEEGRTVLRNYGGEETWSHVMAGGTLTAPRLVLDEVGLYPPLPRSVDHYLKWAVEQAGLGVYRTHGFGFVLERRSGGHTWTPGERELQRGVVRQWTGIPDEADVQRVARP